MVDNWPPLLAFAGAVITAIITVVGTVWVAKSRTKFDLGVSITAGFRELTDQLQEERTQLSETISRQRGELDAAEKENERLDGEMRRLRRRIALLEESLDSAGIKVPRA